MVQLVKSIESEQTFDMVVSTVYAGSFDATRQQDYDIGLDHTEVVQFRPSEKRLLVLITLFHDNLPEGREAFRLQIEGSVANFFPSVYSAATVFIDVMETVSLHRLMALVKLTNSCFYSCVYWTGSSRSSSCRVRGDN